MNGLMKRSFFFVCFLSLATQAYGAMGGYFITDDGIKIVVREFINLQPVLRCSYRGKDVQIPMKVVKKVAAAGFQKLTVEKVDGAVLKVEGYIVSLFDAYDSYSARINYVYYDEISGETEIGEHLAREVEQVVLDHEGGTIKVNPRTGRTYPPDYNFDPHDGTPLEVRELK